MILHEVFPGGTGDHRIRRELDEQSGPRTNKYNTYVNVMDTMCPGWPQKLDWAERLWLQRVALAELILLMSLSLVLKWLQHF